MHHSTYNHLKLSLWSLVHGDPLSSKVTQVQSGQNHTSVMYNDTVTPGMKINSLFGFMVCCTPYYSGTPFKNFGTP